MKQVFPVGLLVDLFVPHDSLEDAFVEIVAFGNVEFLNGFLVVKLIHLLLEEFLVFEQHFLPFRKLVPPDVMEDILVCVRELLDAFSVLLVFF